MSLKVSKVYDTSRVKRNIGLFADILCIFHSVVVKEIIINGQIAIPTVFQQKTSIAHFQDPNLNLPIFNNFSNSKFSLTVYYLTLRNLSERFQYSQFSFLPKLSINRISKIKVWFLLNTLYHLYFAKWKSTKDPIKPPSRVQPQQLAYWADPLIMHATYW